MNPSFQTPVELHRPLPAGLRLQPDSRAGTVYQRVERRRPHERRQQPRPVLFDGRPDKTERRRQRQRTVYDPSRGQWPEPPLGIEYWV